MATINTWRRMAYVIIMPRRAFSGIAAVTKLRSIWLAPLLVTMLVSASVDWARWSVPSLREQLARPVPIKSGGRTLTIGTIRAEDSTASSSILAELTGSASVQEALSVVGSALAAPLGALLGALLLLLVYNVVFHANVKYAHVFCVVALAGILLCVSQFVTFLLQLYSNDAHNTLSLQMFVPRDNRFSAMATFVSPFAAWSIVVDGIGIAAISTLTFRKAIAIQAGLWAGACLLIGGMIAAFR